VLNLYIRNRDPENPDGNRTIVQGTKTLCASAAGGERGSARRAVSPAISVTLMTALVIALAVAVGGFVFVLGDSIAEPPPRGSFEFSVEHNTAGNFGADSNLTITYQSGDTIDPENLELVFEQEPEDLRDGFIRSLSTAPKSGDTLNDITGVDDDLSDSITAGDSVTIPFESDNTLNLVWSEDDGDSSSIIATYERTEPLEPREPLVSVGVDDTAAKTTTTHNWTLSNFTYGQDGDEVNNITVSYPPGQSFDGINETDINVTMRTLSDGRDKSQVEVNQIDPDYGGYTATFDLDGNDQTDVAGLIEIEIVGVENPVSGGNVDITLDGDAGKKTLTGSLPTSTAPVANPSSAGNTSVHTWVIDDTALSSFSSTEVDNITVDYPSNANFSGLDSTNITVTMKRDIDDGTDTEEIDVNDPDSDTYSDSKATFDLSGNFNTKVRGPVVIEIDGIKNPGSDNGVKFTFKNGGTTETVNKTLRID
jgi:Protein of unknown function (DUF1628).